MNVMVSVHPYVKFTQEELDYAKALGVKVDDMLKNLNGLQKPVTYKEALEKVTVILTELEDIHNNWFEPLLKKKEEMKKQAEKIKELTSTQKSAKRT